MPKRIAAFAAQFSLLVLLLIALAAPGLPQDPAPNNERPRKVFPKEQEPEDVLRFDTDLVSVDVTALDADGRPIKPAPDAILALCQQLGVVPAQVAMVGDTAADLRMGRAAGVGLAVGVLSGVGSADLLAPLADVLLPSVAELL